MSAGDGTATDSAAQSGQQADDDSSQHKTKEDGTSDLKRKDPPASDRDLEDGQTDSKRAKIDGRALTGDTDEVTDRDAPRRDSTTRRGSPNAGGQERRSSLADADRGDSRDRRLSGSGTRERFSQEERKRGQRLFGGLLSTLNQKPSNTSQQKRRQEIERRQQQRAREQRAEDDKRHADKLAKIAAARKIQQVEFDEQVMRTRHSNMRDKAKVLHTFAGPRIYYMPYDPTPEQEDKIKDQIQDVEACIRDEIDDFRVAKERRLRNLGVMPQQAPADESVVGEPAPKPSNLSPAEETGHERPATAHGHERDHDEGRDIMVETEEDTVIY